MMSKVSEAYVMRRVAERRVADYFIAALPRPLHLLHHNSRTTSRHAVLLCLEYHFQHVSTTRYS